MQMLVSQADAIGPTDCTVLLTGETGVGKDVLARYIHFRSARAAKKLIAVNCGALSEGLFESEFFGCQRGAYTGAHATRAGLLEAADGATLFLDEVGDMPPLMQVKLLHFLEQGSFRRVGSSDDRIVDVRVIAATNKDLPTAIREGTFRADLYYRLNIISLEVPPLRERREEIPALVEGFLTIFRSRFRRPHLNLSHEARRCLHDYNWPGNIRELRNCLERACALSNDDLIEVDRLIIHRNENLQLVTAHSTPQEPVLHTPRSLTLAPPHVPGTSLAILERNHIMAALEQSNGNRNRAAALLDICPRTLYRKLRRYKIELDASETITNERVA